MNVLGKYQFIYDFRLRPLIKFANESTLDSSLPIYEGKLRSCTILYTNKRYIRLILWENIDYLANKIST